MFKDYNKEINELKTQISKIKDMSDKIHTKVV